MLKILLLCDYSREPDRRLLTGVVSYANERGGWDFYQVDPSLRQSREHAMEIISYAKQCKVDAIFGNWSGIIIEEARKLNIPVILRKENRLYDDFPFLSANNKLIGEIAADYFIRRHYDSFAFFGMKNIIWAAERMESFSNKVRGLGTFNYRLCGDMQREKLEMTEWIKSLPKPVALLAANDFCAQYITQLCHASGISIPEDVAIMGVDNDEFLCNTSCPGITSINLNFQKQGFELARKIEEMALSGKIIPYRIPLDPTGIVERGSTQHHRIKDPYVRDIVSRMETQYTEDIPLSKLLEDIPLSRRSIEMRFREEMAPFTMIQYITHLRLKHFASLLERTTLPVSEAAVQSGFDEPCRVFKLFKKSYGCSPNAYRKMKTEK